MRLFISYSHDSEEHVQRVLNLAQRLRSDGHDCMVDQFVVGSPPEGWRQWMRQNVRESAYTLVLFTARYRAIYEGEIDDNGEGGRGVGFEAALLAGKLYQDRMRNGKIIPVYFDGNNDDVPIELRNWSHYDAEAEYGAMLRQINGQPNAVPYAIDDQPRVVDKLRPGLAWWGEYLRAADHHYSRTADRTTPLDVRLELQVTQWHPVILNKENTPRTSERKSIDEEMHPLSTTVIEANRLVLLGEPGSGKSTSVQAATHELAHRALQGDESPRIPLLIELASFRSDSSMRPGESVLSMALNVFTSLLPENSRIPSISEFKQQMKTCSVLLILDGFNEVAVRHRTACAQDILDLIAQFPDIGLVITSRKYGYSNEFNFNTVEVVELSVERMPEFIDRYVDDGGITSRELLEKMGREERRLAQNPLVLSMTLGVYLHDRALPPNRVLLIERYVEMSVHRAYERITRAGEAVRDISDLLDGLGGVGVKMRSEGLILPVNKVETVITEEGIDDAPAIVQLALKCGLLECPTRNELRFWHQSVQEYFCVRRLADDMNRERRLLDVFFATPAWWETLAMTAGLLEPVEKKNFLNECRATDPYLTAMALTNAREADSPIGNSLIEEAKQAARSVRRWSAFLHLKSTALLAVFVLVINSLFIQLEPFGWYFEIFHSIHTHMVLPGLSLPRSAAVVNWLCMMALAYPLHRYADWLVFGRFQPLLGALQHLGTESARDQLVRLYKKVQESRFVHPSYRALVERGYAANISRRDELVGNLEQGRNLSYSYEALRRRGEPEDAPFVAHSIKRMDDRLAVEDGLRCLESICTRRPDELAINSLVDAAQRVLERKNLPLKVRRQAHRLLAERAGVSANRPTIAFVDVLDLPRRYLPEITVVTLFIALGLLAGFGPPHDSDKVISNPLTSLLGEPLAEGVLAFVFAGTAYLAMVRLDQIGQRYVKRLSSRRTLEASLTREGIDELTP